jgi:hypothetical protein
MQPKLAAFNHFALPEAPSAPVRPDIFSLHLKFCHYFRGWHGIRPVSIRKILL